MPTSDEVPVQGPDGTVKLVPRAQVGDFLAQGGFSLVSKMLGPDGKRKWVPVSQVNDFRKQGMTLIHPDGSFLITPMEGESFLDTMKRASAGGDAVSPELIKQQTMKAIKDTPVVLGAAATAGAVGPAALAAMGESVPLAKILHDHVKQPGKILDFPYGKAVEYYLLGKLGLSKSIISKLHGEGFGPEQPAAEKKVADPGPPPPGPQSAVYHYTSKKGDIFSNDGKTWYDEQGKPVGQ